MKVDNLRRPVGHPLLLRQHLLLPLDLLQPPLAADDVVHLHAESQQHAAGACVSIATRLPRSLCIFLLHVHPTHRGQPLMVHVLLRFVSLPQKPLVFAISNIGSFLLTITLAVRVRQVDGVARLAVARVALVTISQVPDGAASESILVVN